MSLRSGPVRWIALALALTVAACDDPTVPAVTEITIEPEAPTLSALGETVRLVARTVDGDGRELTGVDVAWTSSRPEVAAVDGEGLVTAVANGTAEVTVSAGGISSSTTVTVRQTAAELTLSPADAEVEAGDTVRLEVSGVDPLGSPLQDLTTEWSTDDPDVADVDAEGLVAGVFPGTTTVRATSDGVEAAAEIRVLAPPLEVEIAPEDVVLDPSGHAPLAAEIALETLFPTRVDLTVPGRDGGEDLHWSSDGFRTVHRVPVLGLHPGTDNEIELEVEDEFGSTVVETVVVATDPLPDFLPDVEITVPGSAAMEPGWTLSDLTLGETGSWRTFPIMFDRTGAIRWYLDIRELGEFFSPFERLANGNLLAGAGEAVFEFDMLGNVINRWEVAPDFLQHHDVIEKPDGNLVVAVNNRNIETVDDFIIELDRSSGAVVKEWDLRQVMDMSRTAFIDRPVDWLHVNSVFYDEVDGGLIISARHQGVFKVSAENELLWILAPHKGWGPAGVDGDGVNTADFLLTALDATGAPLPDEVQEGDARTPDFDWGWGQHAAMLLPDRSLYIFDNGDNRQFGGVDPPYSRGVIYDLDEQALTIRQTWAYGRERGREWYGAFVSDVDYLPGTGNRLLMPGIVQLPDGGRGAYVTEVDEAGMVVFEARLTFKNSFGDGSRPDLVYRSERIVPYPERE